MTLDEVKNALASHLAVSVAFDVTRDWFYSTDGHIQMPASDALILGQPHSVRVYGYDNRIRRLLFQNSWGQQWGGNGLGSVPYEYFTAHGAEAWAIRSGFMKFVQDAPEHAFIKPFSLDTYSSWSAYLTHFSMHGVEVYNHELDERLAWALAMERAGFLDIEDLFVRPSARGQGLSRSLVEGMQRLSVELGTPMRFWVADVDYDKDPGGVLAVVRALRLRLCDSGVRSASRIGI
ncbi:C1 family peptidase [Myxococcota bacterium]